jgi:hypothetical protein
MSYSQYVICSSTMCVALDVGGAAADSDEDEEE